MISVTCFSEQILKSMENHLIWFLVSLKLKEDFDLYLKFNQEIQARINRAWDFTLDMLDDFDSAYLQFVRAIKNLYFGDFGTIFCLT